MEMFGKNVEIFINELRSVISIFFMFKNELAHSTIAQALEYSLVWLKNLTLAHFIFALVQTEMRPSLLISFFCSLKPSYDICCSPIAKIVLYKSIQF